MSRVAGAYSRAGGHSPADDLFNEVEDARSDALSEFDRGTSEAAAQLTQFESMADGNAMTLPSTLPLSRAGAPAAGQSGGESAFSSTSSVIRERNHGLQKNLSGLVERVFLPVSGAPARSVAFASIGTDADSGPLAATAAELLAERTPRSVCVIDANFRMPSLHAWFGLPGVSGFAEALALDAPLIECARRLRRNLWVVPAGIAIAPPLLSSAAARLRIAKFVAEFDHVIVNVEPVNPDSDSSALRLVGGVIVVIAADSTRREAARRATQTLAGSGVTVIGAVLTNRRFPIPDALFRLL